ncbi:hypothetical protein Pint_17792 [Pistacia integerrima]|uniref:Uncharacterized protein n=1 Tax=Pistacia integerrima TaxID=434235 RepID=A0ACC0Z071_9ROSI|nr:hypothetical protein Pint_17792 [Pistacia integerrima]
MVLKIKKENNKKGFSSLQVNGVDSAEIAGGEAAITNMHSCNGSEFVLQLNFSLKLGCSTAKSPGSWTSQEANARLKCAYFPVTEAWLPFMDLRQKKGDKAHLLKRCCSRAKCFIGRILSYSFPSLCEPIVLVLIRHLLSLLFIYFVQFLGSLFYSFVADLFVYLLFLSDDISYIYYSTIVARVHQVLKRKGLTWKRGQRVKVFKGACAGVHNNNIYATIEYFLIEGLQGDAVGDAQIICRPIGLMDKEGCVVENNGAVSLDIFGSLLSPIGLIDFGKALPFNAKDGEVPPREVGPKAHYILIESYELDKIQPHYEATWVISPQDELTSVSIPCQGIPGILIDLHLELVSIFFLTSSCHCTHMFIYVSIISGSLKHVTIQSPNFGNNLLPGSVVKQLKFEVFWG